MCLAHLYSASLFFFLLIALSPGSAQTQSGTKERIKVFSHAIAGNLIGDSPERDVTVYLPPSYQTQPEKRFPVLYFLHGFTDTDSQWFGWEEHWINLHAVVDEAMAAGQTKELIVVMPNAYNRFKGSMYSSSATIGDWETFVSKELVAYVDAHYRTIPDVSSRGLAGHSMGGYSTMRLGMKPVHRYISRIDCWQSHGHCSIFSFHSVGVTPISCLKTRPK